MVALCWRPLCQTSAGCVCGEGVEPPRLVDHPRHFDPLTARSPSPDFANDMEAHQLLALINAEFISDPMSVQCFDLRVVERVRVCVAERRKLTEGK